MPLFNPLFGFCIEQEHLVGFEIEFERTDLFGKFDVGIDDAANGGFIRSGVTRNDGFVASHNFDMVYFERQCAVFVIDEALGTNTDFDRLIFEIGVLNDFLTDINFAALDFAVENVDGRSSQEICDKQVCGIVVDGLRFADLLHQAELHNDHDVAN